MDKNNLNTQSKPAPLSSDEAKSMWDKINAGIQKKESNKKKYRQYGVGAIVIILLLTGLLGYNWLIKPDVYFAKTGPISVVLKDGTQVQLLKNAKLTIDKSFPGKTRDVFLSGDAVFIVTKSKQHPFIVHGDNYETKVLGTVFKVSQSGKLFVVDLYEGKVAITKKGALSASTILKPKETFNNFGNLNVTTIETTKDKNFQKITKEASAEILKISFNECSLQEAITVIEKSYNIKIRYPESIAQEKISISFAQEPLENILKALSIYLNLKVNKYEDSYQFEK